VPEWYYLPFYAILRAVPSKLGGVVAMFSAIIVLCFLPWLDTSKVRSAKYRPVYKVFFWLFVASAIGLGYLGAIYVFQGLALGFMLGGVVALLLLIGRKVTRNTRIAFGPYICIGAMAVVLFGV
jgi:quinol-cytochrome oxidoreductase complex cytochrome b subunit